MKHPHAEVIKAWVDGKDIEYRQHNSIRWSNVYKYEPDSRFPAFDPRWEYRIKPAEVVQYTAVFDNGQAGVTWKSNIEDVNSYYGPRQHESFQGYLKRTTVDGKVVKMEFIPK